MRILAAAGVQVAKLVLPYAGLGLEKRLEASEGLLGGPGHRRRAGEGVPAAEGGHVGVAGGLLHRRGRVRVRVDERHRI